MVEPVQLRVLEGVRVVVRGFLAILDVSCDSVHSDLGSSCEQLAHKVDATLFRRTGYVPSKACAGPVILQKHPKHIGSNVTVQAVKRI